MEIILAYDKIDELLKLVKEYTDSILMYGDDVKKCLKSQHIDDELKDIEKKYSLPYGRLYLAADEEKIAGCVGLTKNNEIYCEIKRLYVRPEFRGRQISRRLIEKVINDARDIGYKDIRLDTFPFMQEAISLYKKYGFYYIERYNDNPAETAVFMQLDL